MPKSNKETAVSAVAGMLLVIVVVLVIYAFTASSSKAGEASVGEIPALAHAEVFTVDKASFDRVMVDTTFGSIYFIDTWVLTGPKYTKNNVVINPVVRKSGKKDINIIIELDEKLPKTAISAILMQKPHLGNTIQFAKEVTVWTRTIKEKLEWVEWLKYYRNQMNPSTL